MMGVDAPVGHASSKASVTTSAPLPPSPGSPDVETTERLLLLSSIRQQRFPLRPLVEWTTASPLYHSPGQARDVDTIGCVHCSGDVGVGCNG